LEDLEQFTESFDTFEKPLPLKAYRIASQCPYSLFQVEVEDDVLEISMT
jgi:hypothetical protein